MFVGRRAELDALTDWWRQASGKPCLVWGRRRVGKTALIERFASGLPASTVFHVGVGDPARAELARLTRAVAASGLLGTRDLAAHTFTNWRDALDHLAARAAEKPVLLVLDDFPALLPGSPELPATLAAHLDQWRARTRLRILICGSALRAIWAIQEPHAPLNARFGLMLPVHPFRPDEAAEMLPFLSPEDRALVYGLVGGMPLYLNWWRGELGVRENLAELAGDPGGRLLAEGRLVLETEIGSEQAATALRAIASGATRHAEIQEWVGADPSRALDRLLEARLVDRVSPVTEDPDRSRRKVYRIADNFLAFYLGPLRRHRTEIERGNGAAVAAVLEREMSEHIEPRFAEAFRDCLWRKAGLGSLTTDYVVAIGPWWGSRSGPCLDAVVLAQRDRGRVPVAVGEATWNPAADGARTRVRLIARAAALTDEVDRLCYVVCARSQVTRADASLVALTSADIFPDPP